MDAETRLELLERKLNTMHNELQLFGFTTFIVLLIVGWTVFDNHRETVSHHRAEMDALYVMCSGFKATHVLAIGEFCPPALFGQ